MIIRPDQDHNWIYIYVAPPQQARWVRTAYSKISMRACFAHKTELKWNIILQLPLKLIPDSAKNEQKKKNYNYKRNVCSFCHPCFSRPSKALQNACDACSVHLFFVFLFNLRSMFNGWYYIADVSLVLVHTITWSHCRMLYAHIQRHLASGQTNAGTHKEKEKNAYNFHGSSLFRSLTRSLAPFIQFFFHRTSPWRWLYYSTLINLTSTIIKSVSDRANGHCHGLSLGCFCFWCRWKYYLHVKCCCSLYTFHWCWSDAPAGG